MKHHAWFRFPLHGCLALFWILFSPPNLAGVSAVFTDVALPYRIYSSPAPWMAEGNLGLAFALVVGKSSASGTAMAVDACLADGRRLSGFPKLTGDVMAVAPGNQVFTVGPQRTPMALDVAGQWRPLLPAGAMAGHSAFGLLATPAVTLGSRNAPAGYLMIGRDYRPHVDSRNSLAVFDAAGNLRPGFPLALAGVPESTPPVLDAGGERAWVMLLSGQVDGFSLRSGQRLTGFPTPVPAGERPGGGYRLALGADGTALYVAQGGANLLRIDSRSGQVSELKVPGAERLVGVVAMADGLMVLDEGRGRLMLLDNTGREKSGMTVAPPGASRNLLFAKVALPSDALLLLSAPAQEQGARIHQLYAEQAPREEQGDLAAFMADQAGKRRQGASGLSQEKQKELDAAHLRLKQSWLENALGIDRLAALLRAPPASRIQVIAPSPAGLVSLLDDGVAGFTPETGFSHSEQVFPVLWLDAPKSVRLLVPLNAAASRGDSAAYNRSLVRIYTLSAR